MSPTFPFFIIFFMICISISILFYFLFRHEDASLSKSIHNSIPRSIFPKGLPGMGKKPIEKTIPGMDVTPVKNKLPEAAVKNHNASTPTTAQSLPLTVKVMPPGPPLRKPMMT